MQQVITVSASGVDTLYGELAPGLVRWAFVLTGSPELAEEIVQEAFLALHANHERIEDPTAYVKQVVINQARRVHRRDRLPLVLPAPSAVLPDTGFDPEVWKAVQRLPMEQRLAIVLKHRDDLSNEQIAQYLAKPVTTVKSILHRAHKKLRKELS
jgi:RNA polymerase sigma factor (sigma-70 family)